MRSWTERALYVPILDVFSVRPVPLDSYDRVCDCDRPPLAHKLMGGAGN